MNMLLVAKALVIIISFIVILSTLLSFLEFNNWWIRVCDFPRFQFAILAATAITGNILLYGFHISLTSLITLLLVFCLLHQLRRILPYTKFSRKQVLSYRGHDEPNVFSIMISNVLTTNRRFERLIQLVNRYQPVVLLTLETDRWWEEKLSPLEKLYPYKVKVPMDNYYGMHLFSKLELVNTAVKHMVEDDIPSIHTIVKLPSGEFIKLYCLHPAPPVPRRSETSANRDAELLIVGREVKDCNCPVVVIGDLNDVAWSDTTMLFRRVSGLLDPRVGRGFYNTFHASYRLLRWPLDHIFHSAHFTLVKLKRLPYIGSDHFPIYAAIHLGKKILASEEDPPSQEEMQLAAEKIAEAKTN